jgi:HTH-type transcriptional regulator, sugar sensing transcriptional regulator
MQIEALSQRLRKLGLTEKQSKVYLASLLLGPASAQKLAEQAGINRPTTYDVLQELAKFGLISRSTDDAKTVFVSGGVNGLQDWLKRQAQEVEQRNQQLAALLPELQNVQRGDVSATPIVRFVHGKEGIDAVWSYVVRKAKQGEEILGMTNHDETLKLYPDHLTTNPTVRLSKKMSSKQLYYNSKRAVPSNPTLLKETKRVAVPLAADVTLYEDKAVLLSYGSGRNDWSGIVIESKDIVAVLRQLFYMAWDKQGED